LFKQSFKHPINKAENHQTYTRHQSEQPQQQ